MIESFDSLWDQTRPAFKQERSWRRARALALGALVALGRHTISGMLNATGQQFVDWSAAYRLFALERFDTGALLAPARQAVLGRPSSAGWRTMSPSYACSTTPC